MPFLTEAKWETFATSLCLKLFDNIRLCPATAVLRVPGQVLLPLLPQQKQCHCWHCCSTFLNYCCTFLHFFLTTIGTIVAHLLPIVAHLCTLPLMALLWHNFSIVLKVVHWKFPLQKIVFHLRLILILIFLKIISSPP